jgi:hypothetical protein
VVVLKLGGPSILIIALQGGTVLRDDHANPVPGYEIAVRQVLDHLNYRPLVRPFGSPQRGLGDSPQSSIEPGQQFGHDCEWIPRAEKIQQRPNVGAGGSGRVPRRIGEGHDPLRLR